MEWQLERDRLRALPCPSLLALRFFALHEMIPQYLNLGRRDNGRAPDVPNDAAAATLGTSAKARHISAKSAAKSPIHVPLGNRRRSQGMLIQQAFN